MAIDIATARTEIAKIYIAAFNRVPDSAGLAYWTDVYANKGASLDAIAGGFAGSAEYTAKYPAYQTNAEYVNAIYLNVFGRTSDTAGATFWAGKLADGSLTHATMMNAMLNAAATNGSTDGAKVANQATFAVNAVLSNLDITSATNQLGTITSDTATIATATAATTAAATGQTFTLTAGIDTMPGLLGSAATAGTDGDDTIIASVDATAGSVSNTFTALDTINGGTGADVLNINAITALAIPAGAAVSNVETVNARGVLGVTVNSSTWTGTTALNVTQAGGAVAATAAATTDINVSGAVLGAGTLATVGGKAVTVTHAGVNGTVEGIISVNGAAGAVSVTTTNSLAEDGGIVLGALTANAGTVAVQASGNGNIVAGGGVGGALDTIAATGGTTITVNQDVTAINNIATAGVLLDVVTQGAVNVTGTSATTSVTVTQDDQVTAVAAVAAIAGVSQTQTVTFSAMTTGQSVTVNGLTFTAAKNLTAAEVAAAFSNLTDSVTANDLQSANGPTANGIYTGSNLTLNYSSGAANGAVVTYTATVQAPNTAALTVASVGATAPVAALAVTGVAAQAGVTGVAGVANGAVTIADGGIDSITHITVDGYAASTINANALTNLTLKNSGAGTMGVTTTSTGAMTLNLNDVDAAVTLAASLTSLTVNTSGTASTGAISAAGATTVTINAEAALSGASTYTAATLIDVNGTAAVNLTGATTNAATLATIDASGNTGGVTAVLGAANSVKFTGGAGKDSLTLGAATIATGKNIDMGAGDDTLVVAAATTATSIVGTVTGGTGTDTLSMGYADAVAVSANLLFDAEVLDFERLTINNVASNNDAIAGDIFTVNLANLTYNYVTANGTFATAADTLALTGMAANGTVAFGGLSTGTSVYTVALADAAGTADVVNYVLASTNETSATAVADTVVGTANNAGTITANLVETFNISSTAVDKDGATNVIAANGDTVTSIVVTGNAGVTLTSTNTTTLKTVDASASTAGTLTYTAASASMTVKGGAGADMITIAATADGSTFYGNGGNDTFAIAAATDLVTIHGGAGADVFDFNGVSTNKSNFVVLNTVGTGDVLDFAGLVDGVPATTFNAAKITLSLGATETTQAYLDQAMTTLAENGFGWFQYNGNTYIAGDVGTADSLTSFADGVDFAVMLTGLVDLSKASFNATSNTLEIA